ncbi:MAG: hypothetical protein KAS16_09055 [Thermoplasmata archaeon]|nr:hypothetical protein [Thermoplasmata archaeon]
MRASTKYLLKIPLEFALVFGFVSLFWYGFFSYLEYGAGMITEIHDHLPYYSMLLALIISLNCLVIMTMEYLDRSSSEKTLDKYLIKMGAFPLSSHAPVPVRRR